MTRPERIARTARADVLCAEAWRTALREAGPEVESVAAGPDPRENGLALVAVGGYGRAELAPFSDLDLVLVHADGVDVRRVAERVWYPLWDARVDLDHSVRALSEVEEASRSDPRVAVGLLDVRHLAGDRTVTLQLRSGVLTAWRRGARDQLPALREMTLSRGRRTGELAHASVPDLKESVGGLRDATVLKALVATWLVDVPHVDLERVRRQLLDVRDVLHEASGRATDRVAPELWPELARRLGLADAETAQRHVRELGRRITHLNRLTWRRVDAVLARPANLHRRAPDLTPIGGGLSISSGEVVLGRDVRPGADPLLLLRAAAEAAERDLVLAPATAARLTREGPPLSDPWPSQARQLFARLLAGPGLLPVWETLDETGALSLILPEWELVRLLPHASVVHRFTVDRHLVETCLESARLIRRVARPDVLMVAALLHDLGKGRLGDHSVVGQPVAEQVAARMGFGPRETALVGRLVRWHLLLAEIATTRDLEDPATIAHVADRVGDQETLDLLAVVTEADALATSPKAWSSWRAGLVGDLVARVRDHLARPGLAEDQHAATEGGPEDGPEDGPGSGSSVVPEEVRADPRRMHVEVAEHPHGTSVRVVSGDRTGLIADIAGGLALQHLSVRRARAWTQDEVGFSVWEVGETGLDPAIVRQRVVAVAEGRLTPTDRLRGPRPGVPDPSVQVQHEASREATVIEVRVDDREGVVFVVCAALAALGVSVRSAHVATLGPQAVDVFYVQESGAGSLSEERAASAAHAVRRALHHPVRLGP